MRNNKLEIALIETGKEAEKVGIPSVADLDEQYQALHNAILSDDLKAIRQHGRALGAMVVKIIVERC